MFSKLTQNIQQSIKQYLTNMQENKETKKEQKNNDLHLWVLDQWKSFMLF